MKMVASAKLHRVQGQAQAAAEYERGLSQIAAALTAGIRREGCVRPLLLAARQARTAVVVAFSSDGSLCGSFNANAVKALAQQVERLRAEGFDRVTVIPVGGKIAQAAAEAGYDTDGRFRTLVSNPACEGAAALADALMAEYAAGEADRVVLVYNHFRSMGRQTPCRRCFCRCPQAKNGPAACRSTSASPGRRRSSRRCCPRRFVRASMRCCSTALRPSRRPAPLPCRPPRTTPRSCWTTLSLTYNKRRQQAITDELADITPAE